ncbi:hypothetical protein OQX63_04930 [Pedobacter sp. PF22-3]|uniref:hypothetical protein n=1 Tax=Pedobacter TaxID=84567 RepID=UPI00046986F0|nr:MULTISPECIES: hypothetical protein [Pedobacter]MCX2492803.1 hypothetical protein [Pedobacter sp. PF22-3]
MTRDQLREESQRLMFAENLSDSKDVLDIYINLLFKIINEHTDQPASQAKREAKLVLQMVFTKMLNLRQLIDGLNYAGEHNGLRNFIDPTIVASAGRSVVELTATFHLIYRSEYSEAEKDMLYQMWVLAGLKYRQRFVGENSSEENKQKAAIEASEIADITERIKTCEPYTVLSEKDRELIDKTIDAKEYRVNLDNGRASKMHWQQMIQFMGFKAQLTGSLYTYFSLYAHPSNVSVFQYRDLFNTKGNDHISMAMFNTKNITAMLSKFISDYIRLFPEVQAIFGDTPLLHQILINWTLRLTTDNTQPINEAMNALN